MATATIKFNPFNPPAGSGDIGQRTVNYFGTITFSAATDTYATGGLTTVLTPTTPLLQLGAPGTPTPYADRNPLGAWIQTQAGSGFTYVYNTTTKKLQIYGGGGSGTQGNVEVTNGTALNTANVGNNPTIFADVVFYWFVFPRI